MAAVGSGASCLAPRALYIALMKLPIDPVDFRYTGKGCIFLRTFQKFRCEVYPNYLPSCSAGSDGCNASTTCYVEHMLITTNTSGAY